MFLLLYSVWDNALFLMQLTLKCVLKHLDAIWKIFLWLKNIKPKYLFILLYLDMVKLWLGLQEENILMPLIKQDQLKNVSSFKMCVERFLLCRNIYINILCWKYNNRVNEINGPIYICKYSIRSMSGYVSCITQRSKIIYYYY